MNRIGPSAALHVDWTGSVKPGPPASVYFFKEHQYIRWNVDAERLDDTYPWTIEEGWPGLLGAAPDAPLSGAMHVPGWGNRVYFFYRGEPNAIAWDVASHTLVPEPVPIATLMPSTITAPGHFAPLFVDWTDRRNVYAFRGDTYTRFTVRDGELPVREDEGYPRKIGDGWTGGFSVAPSCAVSVYWTARNDQREQRKIYFFLGDLYTRWDVASHSKNYELDVPSGWVGWPDFR